MPRRNRQHGRERDPRQHHDGKRPRISDSRRLFFYRCNLAIQPSREEVDDLSHQIAWPPRGDTGPRSAPLLAAFAAPTSPAARKILTTICAFAPRARSTALTSAGVNVTAGRASRSGAACRAAPGGFATSAMLVGIVVTIIGGLFCRAASSPWPWSSRRMMAYSKPAGRQWRCSYGFHSYPDTTQVPAGLYG